MTETTATAALPPPPALGALRLVFWGLLVVLVDLRVNGPDLVPDPLGWLLALVAVLGLRGWHRGFSLAAAGCGLGLLASLPDWARPDVTWVSTLTTVATTLVVFGTCTALMALVPGRRAGANAIRWWDLALTAPVVLLGALLPGPPREVHGPVATVLVLVLALAVLLVFVSFLVLVLRASRGPGEKGPPPA